MSLPDYEIFFEINFKLFSGNGGNLLYPVSTKLSSEVLRSPYRHFVFELC